MAAWTVVCLVGFRKLLKGSVLRRRLSEFADVQIHLGVAHRAQPQLGRSIDSDGGKVASVTETGVDLGDAAEFRSILRRFTSGRATRS